MRLRLHKFVPCSYANGPGRRAVVWVQGCTLRCPGCFNPLTHAAGRGQWSEVDSLLREVLRSAHRLEGISLSGGEPLQQLPAVTELVRRIKDSTPLTAILFTGYAWDEIGRLPGAPALLNCLDVVIAGRYVRQQRLARDLRGSSNKTVHFLTTRYTLADLNQVPCGELILGPDALVQSSGIDPVVL